MFALGQLFIRLRGGVICRERFPLRNCGLSANFLIAFRLVGYGNRYEFVFRPVGLISVLKSRDEYYYVENKYQGLFIPCVKSRVTR